MIPPSCHRWFSMLNLLQHITFNEYLPMVLGKRNLHRHGENFLGTVLPKMIIIVPSIFNRSCALFWWLLWWLRSHCEPWSRYRMSQAFETNKQTNKNSNRHSKQTNILRAWKAGWVLLFGTAILIPLSSNHNIILAKPNWQVKLSQQLPTDSDTPFYRPPLNDGQQGSPLAYK